MIIDSILGLEKYRNMNPDFEKAFKFLRTNDLDTIEEGIHNIDGANIYAIVSENQMQTADKAKLEVHDAYIDIQVPITNSETFGWKDRIFCDDPNAKYDESKDVTFFDLTPDAFVMLEPKQIAIFFPQDAHAPLIGTGKIKKIVIKIKI